MKIGKIDPASEGPISQGPAFFSYGFRPFFLGAALFAGLAIPAWIVILAGEGIRSFSLPPGTGMCMRWSSAFSPL